MTEEQKKPYQKRADEDKARYDKEIEEEKRENGGKVLPNKAEALKMEKLRKERMARGLPPIQSTSHVKVTKKKLLSKKEVEK